MSRILCTSASSRLLHVLAALGPLDVPGIARALGVKPSHVRHQLCALRHRGFVSRTSLYAGSDSLAVPGLMRYAADSGNIEHGLTMLLFDFGADHE